MRRFLRLRSGLAIAFSFIACGIPAAQAIAADFYSNIAQRVALSSSSDALCDITFASTTRVSAGVDITSGDFNIRSGGSLSLYAGDDLLLGPESPLYSAQDISLDATIDEFLLSWNRKNFRVEAGRSKVNWGQGTFFSPADIFSVYVPSGGIPRRKPLDFARLSLYPSATSKLEIVAAPFENDASLYAARAYAAIGEMAAGALGFAYRSALSGSDALLATGEFTIDFPLIAPRGEVFASIDPLHPESLELKALSGFLTRILNLTLLVEYGFDGIASSPHLGFLSLSYPIDEWLSFSATTSAAMPSGITQISFSSTLSSLAGFDISTSISGRGAVSQPADQPPPPWQIQANLLVSRRF